MTLRMQIAVFDGFDEIDVFGPYEILSSAGVTVELATVGEPTAVRSMRGLTVTANGRLDACDGIIVPGGGWMNRAEEGAWAEVQNGALPDRLNELAAGLPWLASVCSGGMVLASAGLFADRPATTNPSCYEELRPLVGEVIDERVVDDGDRISAGALFCGVDLALRVVEREFGTAKLDRVLAASTYPAYGRVWHAPSRA